MYEAQDSDQNCGVRLSKDIVKVAGKCMEKNMTTIGPYVLPLSEQIPVVTTLALRFVIKVLGKLLILNGKEKLASKLPNKKHYVPDFKRGIDHFCIHAGGRADIDGMFHPFPSLHLRVHLRLSLTHVRTHPSTVWLKL